MKPAWLIVVSALASGAFAIWVVRQGRDDREIWIALIAWLLGFWFASRILSERNPEGSEESEEADPGDEEYEDWE